MMKWQKLKGEYRSDCGTFTIKKTPTHGAAGNRETRYPWELYKGEVLVCCYGLLSEAKASA